MKRTILLLIMALPMLAMIGCASAPSDGGEIKEETETAPASEARLDLISLTYYYHHGSMAGMDYSYSISQDATGAYLFHAEIESEARIVDREISQEQFDAIVQIYNDNYAVESADEADAYMALDASRSGFDVTFADGQTQSIDIRQTNNEIVLQLKKLLEGSSTE